MITQAFLKEAVHYNPETGEFKWLPDRPIEHFKTPRGYKTWKTLFSGKETGSLGGCGYIRLCINKKLYRAHRLAWLYVHGSIPDSEIDHINGNRSDNRICNLRLASSTDNNRNSRLPKNNTSGSIGVTWQSSISKWVASIWKDSKRIHLGSFDSKSEAIKARKAAELEHGYHENHGRG